MDRLLELTYQAEARHFWFRGFRRFVSPWIARAAGGRRDLRLLDCGCGTGANLALLEPFGRAYGFDLTFRGLEFARQHGRTRVARASIGAIPFPDAAFDVVTSFDVLYGLPDDVEHAAAREMRRVLKPGGRLVITSAALDSLRGGHSTFSNEVRRYTKASLTALLEGAGLDVERITYTHAAIFPLLFAVRTGQRLSGGGEAPATESELSVPSAPVNNVLSAMLAVEATALRVMNMPIGSSVLCLARRRD